MFRNKQGFKELCVLNIKKEVVFSLHILTDPSRCMQWALVLRWLLRSRHTQTLHVLASWTLLQHLETQSSVTSLRIRKLLQSKNQGSQRTTLWNIVCSYSLQDPATTENTKLRLKTESVHQIYTAIKAQHYAMCL